MSSPTRRPPRTRSPRSFKDRYGPWALVLGCAEGMGAAYAERLAREGFNLALLDLRRTELRAQARRLAREHGIETRALVCDLSRQKQVEASLAALVDVEVGLVIFNAALAANGDWVETTLATKLAAVQVNVVAVLTVADRLSRPMIERGRGGIILTSSMAALQGAPRQTVYAATKSFDLILAESLWGELKPHGVDVLAFIPGMVSTPNFKRSGAATQVGVLAAVEPAEAVEEALAGLGKGPRTVPGRLWKLLAAATSLVPRKSLIEAMGRSMEGLRQQ